MSWPSKLRNGLPPWTPPTRQRPSTPLEDLEALNDSEMQYMIELANASGQGRPSNLGGIIEEYINLTGSGLVCCYCCARLAPNELCPCGRSIGLVAIDVEAEADETEGPAVLLPPPVNQSSSWGEDPAARAARKRLPPPLVTAGADAAASSAGPLLPAPAVVDLTGDIEEHDDSNTSVSPTWAIAMGERCREVALRRRLAEADAAAEDTASSAPAAPGGPAGCDRTHANPQA